MDVFINSLTGTFVTANGGRALKQYDYHGIDQSIIVEYYRPFWKFLVGFIPSTWSPNVVTLIGLCFPVSGLLFMFFGGDQPWVYIAYAIFLFIYQTFDALDGQQGKKVGMYTHATTEFFDHGVDSVVLVISTLMGIRGMHLNGSWFCPLFVVCALCGFYFPTWENLNTGVMYFRGGFSNPTEGLAISQLMFLVTGIFPHLWDLGLFGLQLKHVVVLIGVLSAANAGYTSIKTVQEHHIKTAKTNRTSFSERLLGLVPMALVAVVGIFWFIKFDSSSSYQNWPMQAFAIMSITIPWNYALIHVIVAEITKTSMDINRILICMSPILFPLVPLYWGILEGQTVILSCLLSLGIYIFTVHKVLTEICHSMGMPHFWTIQPDCTFNKKQ